MHLRTLLLLSCFGIVAFAGAQDRLAVTADVSLELASKYVWHGIDVVNDWVLQPGIDLGYGNLTVSFWGNLELTSWNAPNYTRNPRGRFTEIDTSVEYGSTLGRSEWNLGIVDYQFPGTGSTRYREWFAGMSSDDLWGSPSLTIYTGDNSATGTYATLCLTKSMPVKLRWAESLDVCMELTWGDTRCNQFLYGRATSGLSDIHLRAGTEIELGKGWSLSPGIHYSTLLQQGLLEGQPRRTNVWASFAVNAKF